MRSDFPNLVEVCRDTIPPPGVLLREVGGEHDGARRFRTFEATDGPQIHVGGIGVFWVASGGAQVRYALEEGADLADAHHVLVGPVLGIALQAAGTSILHAAGFDIGGRAVALSAPSGMGKSTLCAHFAKSGFSLISDDMLVIDQNLARPAVHTFLPKIKLWDDTLEGLDEDPSAYPTTMTWMRNERSTHRQTGYIWPNRNWTWAPFLSLQSPPSGWQ